MQLKTGCKINVQTILLSPPINVNRSHKIDRETFICVDNVNPFDNSSFLTICETQNLNVIRTCINTVLKYISYPLTPFNGCE